MEEQAKPRSRDTVLRVSALKPKQVRSLYEEFPPAVEQSAACGVLQLAIAVGRQRQQQILKIAVVADVSRRAGMHEISYQEIRVEVLGGLKGSEIRIREHGVVLADEPEGEFSGELVIPLGPDDVIVHGAKRAVQTAEAEHDVRVVDPQRPGGPDCEGYGRAVPPREKRRDRKLVQHLNERRIVVYARAEAIIGMQREFPEIVCIDCKFRGVTNIFLDAGERREVLRPQPFHFLSIQSGQERLADQFHFHSRKITGIDAISHVIVDFDVLKLWSP